MRIERVMLVNPQYSGHYTATVPTGLGYIAEALVNAGMKYDFVDLGLNHSVTNLKNRILSFRPELIGWQVMTYRHKQTYERIRQIKKMFPHILIIVGGPHISSERIKVLEQNEAIDYGVVLEGEKTIVELCSGDIPLSDIKGLIFRQNEKIIYTGDRKFIEDIDSIPFPKYKKFDLTKYPSHSITIVSSRGCPYRCIYCPVKVSIGTKIRFRSPTSVADEIEYWYRLGYKRFGFADDNFTLLKGRVHEICDEIERRGIKGLQLLCGNGIRADKTDRFLLQKMRQAGFTWLAFGVEAGNNRILKRVKKDQKIEDVEKAISIACELGFDVNLFFLVGSPGETEADIQDSINLALRYPVAKAAFYNLIPYPNTELYDWVKQNDYFLCPPENYLNDASGWVNNPVFETPELPFETRKRMFRICKQVTKKIERNYLRRKLAKYGILGDFLANLYVSEFVQKKMLPNTKLKKLVKWILKPMYEHVFASANQPRKNVDTS